MSDRIKFILGLSIFVTLIGVYFLDEYLSQKEERFEQSNMVALFFQNEDVKKISLQNSNGTFSFERINDSEPWIMTSPKKLFADQNAVNNLLVLLRNISIQSANTETKNIESTGLNPPNIHFELVFQNGTTKTLDLGFNLATDNEFNLPSAYAKSSDKNKILIVDNSSFSIFNANNYQTFRTKQLTNFIPENVSKIEIVDYTQKTQAPLTMSLNKNVWSLETPIQTSASHDFITQYLQSLKTFNSGNIAEVSSTETENAYGISLDKPAATLAFFDKKNKELEKINLYMSTNGLYAQLTDGGLAQFDLDMWPELVPQFKFFRNRNVFSDVDCSAKFSTLTAVDILDDVTGKRLEEFGLKDPQKILSCKEHNDQEPQLLIGNRVPLDEKNVYLKRSDLNTVYIVDSELLSALAD